MPIYNRSGNIPDKRHTIYKNPKGKKFYEELVSRKGFSGIYSNIYHLNRPTKIKKIGKLEILNKASVLINHRPRHLHTSKINKSGDLINSKTLLFYNEDINISTGNLNESMNYYFRNGLEDMLLYIQSGNGKIKTNFGDLDCIRGDYIIIPRGIIWKLEIVNSLKTLIIESSAPIETPSRYRNEFGQLLEHSPFCERDIVLPILQDPNNINKETLIKVKNHIGVQEIYYDHDPCDVVGWDGYYFPWKINIKDFEPIVGRIHQPPPVHQTFQSSGFVICSFVPRLFDFHPKSIPAPYPHSNIDSDEVIFYSKGNFMSRKGIGEESITLHPMGMPHGPQPGKYFSSVGKEKTDELAVMIDTFKPLQITTIAKKIDDKSYPYSWLD
tara:strand:+ start:3109 stop:4257 length:1149 start_codon:yes stop_codon:yes gene_type:complete